MIKGGNNTGRVGVITTREKHPGSYEIDSRQGQRGQFLLHPDEQRHGHRPSVRRWQRVDLAAEGQGYQAHRYRGPRPAHAEGAEVSALEIEDLYTRDPWYFT